MKSVWSPGTGKGDTFKDVLQTWQEQARIISELPTPKLKESSLS